MPEQAPSDNSGHARDRVVTTERTAPFTVVLTGGIASGKSAVSERFAKLGVPVVDTDRIARELVAPGQPALEEIVRVFGAGFLDPAGRLDRARLRSTIFSDHTQKTRLEQILHPRIAAEAERRVSEAAGPYCILVVPLYAESARWAWIDRVLVVDAERSVQLARLMARDNIGHDQAEAMIQAQAGRPERLALADDVIDNNGRIEDLQRQVEILHRKYVQLATAD